MRTPRSCWTWLTPGPSLACLAVAGWMAAIPRADAGTLELRQGAEVGAGTGFRRGEACHVLTAAHVVEQPGVDAEVLDRSGARAKGHVSYANPAYDVALVTLAPGAGVACSESWPESDWMAGATWTPSSEFDVVRHSPSGRESVIVLKWAGGTRDNLTLRPVDRTDIKSADSGSLVRFGGRMVGIVARVDTGIDRVEVVRFDLIDRLLGERFRGSGTGAVMLEGVFQRGRVDPKLTAYVSDWLTSTARRAVVATSDASARCHIRAEVIDWSQRNVPNPKASQAQEQLKGCKANLLYRNSTTLVKMCEDSARAAIKSNPRTLRVHSLQLKVNVVPRGGAALSRLDTVDRVVNPAVASSQADLALSIMQGAFAEVAQEMIASGACD